MNSPLFVKGIGHFGGSEVHDGCSCLRELVPGRGSMSLLEDVLLFNLKSSLWC